MKNSVLLAFVGLNTGRQRSISEHPILTSPSQFTGIHAFGLNAEPASRIDCLRFDADTQLGGGDMAMIAHTQGSGCTLPSPPTSETLRS
jgi:hypothetical protein